MANRYWVGDGGNWSDSDHWSTTSGGSGGASPPTFSDPHDVHFDLNSFTKTGQTVVMDSYNSTTCDSMDWTGVQYFPTMHFPDHNLTYHRCYGNFILSENMQITYQDASRFSLTLGKYASSGGEVSTTDTCGHTLFAYHLNFINRKLESDFTFATYDSRYADLYETIDFNGFDFTTYCEDSEKRGLLFIRKDADVYFRNGTVTLKNIDYRCLSNEYPESTFVHAGESTLKIMGANINIYNYPNKSDPDPNIYNKIVLSSYNGFNVSVFQDISCKEFEITNPVSGVTMVSFLEEHSGTYPRTAVRVTCDMFTVGGGDESDYIILKNVLDASGRYEIYATDTALKNMQIERCRALNNIPFDASSNCIDGGNNENIWFGEQVNIISKRSNNK